MKIRNVIGIILMLNLSIAFVPSHTLSVRKKILNSHGHKKNKKLKKKFRGNIISVTIPKSGTHLLLKCLTLFKLKGMHHPTHKKPTPFMINKIRRLNQSLPPNHYRGLFHTPTVGPVPIYLAKRLKANKVPHSFWTHWPYTSESARIFKEHGFANFFMMRDPRDQVISMAFMVHENFDGKKIPFETALLDLIDGKQRMYIPWAVEIQATHPLMWEGGLVDFYKLYLPWMRVSNFHTVKFENLVGEQGGGTKEAQLKEINAIAHHLNLNLSSAEIHHIAKKLFGGTSTFREGKIGAWKKYFTPHIKQVFKNVPGACQLLIELGYEENENW